MADGLSGATASSRRDPEWIPDVETEIPPAPRAKVDPCDVFGPTHSFDQCPSFSVQGSKLFAKAPGETSDIAPNDVQQRKTGDCFVAAPLVTLAQSEAGRAHLRSMIQENRGPDGKVQSYTVTFKEPDPTKSSWFGLRNPQRDVKIDVTPEFPRGTFEAKDGEIWPAVIEKAYAQWKGGYDQTVHGGNAIDVYSAMGLPTTRNFPKDYDGDQLVKDAERGKAITIGTLRGVDDLGLVDGHDYALVFARKTEDGQVWVKLKNPWGHQDPPLISYSDLQTRIHMIDVATP